MKFDLTGNEREVLADSIESCLGDLKREISETENRDYREMLKTRKRILLLILDQLEPGLQGARESDA